MIVHFICACSTHIILPEEPLLPGPAYSVVIGIGDVKVLTFRIRRKGGTVRFGASGDSVEHINKFAQLRSGLSAEGIRSFRIHIPVAVHIQNTGLIKNALDIRKYHSVLQTAAARLFVEDVRVIITVDNIAGELELVFYIEAVCVEHFVGDAGVCMRGDDGLSPGVIAEGFRQKRLVRQHGHMDPGG